MERNWKNRAINRITKEDRAFLRVGSVRGHRWERQGDESQEGKKQRAQGRL